MNQTFTPYNPPPAQPPPPPAYNFKLPFLAFGLIVGAGVLLSAVLLIAVDVVYAVVVFCACVLIAIVVALGIIMSDRQDFRDLMRSQLAHDQQMARIREKTERIRVEGMIELSRPKAPPALNPGTPAPQMVNLDGNLTPREDAWTVSGRDGIEVKVDILDALITLGFGPYEITNVRDSLKEHFPNLKFRALGVTAALQWLRDQCLIDAAGKWIVDEPEARAVLADARAAVRAAVTSPANVRP